MPSKNGQSFVAEALAAKKDAEDARDAAKGLADQAVAIMERADQEAKDAMDKADKSERPTLEIRKDALRAVRDSSRQIGEYVRKAKEASDRAKAAARSAAEYRGHAAKADSAAKDAASAAASAEEFAKQLDRLEKDAKKEYDAAVAAELYLKVADFFTHYELEIYKRLEECDDVANREGERGGMVFIGEGLPIINGIIYVGAKREDLSLAKEWVKETWGKDAHPRIVLSALMFIYVTDLGAQKYKEDEDPKKREKWARIHRRVHSLL